jgi:hypothetical protein
MGSEQIAFECPSVLAIYRGSFDFPDLIIFSIFDIFLRIMSDSVLLHRQRSPQDLRQLLAWYKIRDTLLGYNWFEQDIKKALELACVCEHPNAVWLTKLFGGHDVKMFGGHDVNTKEAARRVFLGCGKDPRALCFAGLLAGLLGASSVDEIRRAAELGDAFAQAWVAWPTVGEERFRWTEKSSVQGERDAFYHLGHCYQYEFGCEKDAERAKENFLVAAELGHVNAMGCSGGLLGKDDPQRFVWFGRAALSGYSVSFLNEMSEQIHNFNSRAGRANVVFSIGKALTGQIDNEKRAIFGNVCNFDALIDPANQALHFYEFQLQSYRKAVDSWTIVGLRNKVVKDIRKMIGNLVWDAREEAAYLEQK